MLYSYRVTGNGSIDRIYLVRKTLPSGYFYTTYIVEFHEDIGYDEDNTEEQNRIMHAIFEYLDSTPEHWQYGLYTYDTALTRVVKKVKGCCIYTKTEE